MTKEEAKAQYITEIAWLCARELGVEFTEKNFAVKQDCDFCNKSRGIGYITFTEDGQCKCLYCE